METTLTLEVITPLFMSGADSRKLELRATSFKGLMRFWWRAMKAENNIFKLQSEEEAIFGGTQERKLKSPFNIRINAHLDQNDIEFYRPLPHSLTKRFTLPSIRTGFSFEIRLSSRQSIEYIENLLKICMLLGSFGKRSRRGFGKILWRENGRIIEFNSSTHCLNYLIELFKKLDVTDLKTEEHDNFRKMVRNNILCERFSYPVIKEIYVGNVSRDWSHILKKVGESSSFNRDYALGSERPRMASPIWVSLVRIRNQFAPIITRFCAIYPLNYPKYNPKKIDEFINYILK